MTGGGDGAGPSPRRVLMLAYFFPPNSSGGVPRTVHFVKYLEKLGWASTVIAPDWRPVTPPSEDAGFVAAVPAGTEVVHAGVGGDDSPLWKFLHHRVPRFWRVEPAVRDALQYPDRFARWAREALPAARRLLARDRHHVVYSTSPPVTSHLVALRLKRELGVPWVADFRDPWTDNLLLYGRPPAWRRWVDRRLERSIYRVADRVVANTDANRAAIVTGHGIPAAKVTTITNGYDEDDFAGVRRDPPPDRFRIAYGGAAYDSYNPSAFLRALKVFLAREPEARVSLALAGDVCRWATENVHDPDLSRHLELLGHLPHRETCRLLAASHLLLHTYPEGVPYSVPGKLYEYLRSGTPILAVCGRPSEIAALLERTGRGRTFRPDETEAVVEHLRALYGDWSRRAGREPGTTPDPTPDEATQAYDRRALTQRLARTFDAVAGSPG